MEEGGGKGCRENENEEEGGGRGTQEGGGRGKEEGAPQPAARFHVARCLATCCPESLPQSTALHPAALHLIALWPYARCLAALWPTALHPALERCTPLLQCSPSPAALQTAARSRVACCLIPRCFAARRLLPSSLLPVAA